MVTLQSNRKAINTLQYKSSLQKSAQFILNSSCLVIKAMKFKATFIFHFTQVRIANIKGKPDKCWRLCRKKTHLLLVRIQTGIAIVEISVDNFSKRSK